LLLQSNGNANGRISGIGDDMKAESRIRKTKKYVPWNFSLTAIL